MNFAVKGSELPPVEVVVEPARVRDYANAVACTAVLAAVRDDGVRYADADLTASVEGKPSAAAQAAVRLT